MRCFLVLQAIVLTWGCSRSYVPVTGEPAPAARPPMAAVASQACPRGADADPAPSPAASAYRWTRQYGGDGNDEAASVALHPSGDIVVTGQLAGAVAFGHEVVNRDSQGRSDVFVARFTPAGELVWVRSVGGAGDDFATAVAADAAGNVLVLGGFHGRMSFAGAELRARGPYDLFVAGYSPDGDERWAVAMGGPSWEVAEGLAVDVSGDIVVAGAFDRSLTIDEQVLESAGDADAFVARLAPDGRHLWSRRLGRRGWDEANAVAVDRGGNAIVAGALSGANTSHGFVVKYSAQGEEVWMKQPEGSADVCATAVTVAGDDTILVAGGFRGSLDLGGGPLDSAGERDLFVAGYDQDGRHLWSRRFGGARGDCARTIAAASQRDFVVAGAVSGDVSLGGETLRAGHLDIFVARYTTSGEHVWSQTFPGAGAGTRSVAALPDGRVVVAGSFPHTIDFGGDHELTSTGGLDAFIAVVAPTRTGPWTPR